MFFWCFSNFCRSEYFEINPSKVSNYLDGTKNIVVKFYRPNCPHCQAMAEEFQQASELFSSLDFAGINCDAHHKTCLDLGVDAYPSIKIYLDNNRPSLLYQGDYTIESIKDFAEKKSGIKAHHFSNSLHILNALTLENFKTASPCTLILYYTPWEKINKRFLSSFREAADVFIGDSNVSLGSISCARYQTICSSNNVNNLPNAYFYLNGTKMPYTESQLSFGIVSFINKHCGTNRGLDGLLSDTYGLVEGAYQIAQAYRNSTDSEKLILKEKMKQLQGTEFYIKVMERIDKFGLSKIEQDIKNMRTFMEQRKGSMKTIDSMKKNFNIMTEFEELPSFKEIREMETSPEKDRLMDKTLRLNPESIKINAPEPIPMPTPKKVENPFMDDGEHPDL